ncbi:MAG: S8 family serine peptidase [Ignavibacteriae bacterium]|nr:S8 family serine peptidase [Ignavibacteriota bacterium]
MKIVSLLLVLLISSISFTQNNNLKYSNQLENKVQNISDNEQILVWIYLNDKGNNLQQFFNDPKTVVSERSLKRRSKVKPIDKLIDYSDIPITEEYVEKLSELGIKIKHRSKWLNAVSCYVTKDILQKLQTINFVKKLDEVKIYKREKDDEINKNNQLQTTELQPNNISANNYDYGQSFAQNNMMNVPTVHDLGYTGEGVLICVMDAGFDRLSHESFSTMNIIATKDFVNGDEDVEDGADMGEGSHGTSTLSQIGGFKEGELIGTAFGSDFILAKTENTESETQAEEDNWVAAAEWADSIGADLFSTSLGYIGFDGGGGYTHADMDGNTALITIAADLAVGKGIVVFNSAGNEGFNSMHNTLGAPADGDSVIAIGAVDANKNRASFSSVGLTVDGRIKPDLMAMGSGTWAASRTSNTSYRSFSGTSASCPIAAGVGALLLEKNSSLTPIEIRTILRNTADNSNNPNKIYGWGIIDALGALNEVPSVLLQTKIFLEGAYNSSLSEMIDSLNLVLPKTSPYSENPRTIFNIPNNIVDWVLVELRESENGNAIISRSALLHKDGRIVSDNGLSNAIELGIEDGDYYIVIKHRNHIAVMSKNKVSLSKTSSILYDFTTGSDKFYGIGGTVNLGN